MVLGSLTSWVIFVGAVIALLVLDLVVFNRKPHEVSATEAAIWSAVWIGLSLAFNAYIWWYDHAAGALEPNRRALEFLTGYLIEKSLSVDNLFVFLVIFSYFKVPASLQHRVLFWGILGALVMRGAFIGAGTALLQKWKWVMIIFGGLLVVTGGRMLFSGGDDEVEPEKNPVLRLLRRLGMPTTSRYHGAKFFTTENARRVATPLFIVLIVIETTDLVFALDSIPAIFAITLDPFIVFTSNICAILGLRALYFLLHNMMGKFRYLKPALALVLLFIGVKMVLSYWELHVPIGISLAVVGALLAFGIVASLLNPAPPAPPEEKPETKEEAAAAGAAGTESSEGDQPADLDRSNAPKPPIDETMDGDV